MYLHFLEAGDGSALECEAESGSALKSKFLKLYRLKMELWGAWRLKWCLGGSIDPWSQIPITLMRSRILIRIKVITSWIRIRIRIEVKPLLFRLLADKQTSASYA